MRNLIKFLFGRKWVLIETLAGVWVEQQSGYLSKQEYCYYFIEYNDYLDEFRLTMEGKTPKKNRAYLNALQTLQAYNNGDVVETYFENPNVSIPKKIVIVHYPISEDRDYVFKQASNDKDLIAKKEEHKKRLEDEKIDIYEDVKNILITDKGYYIAIWQDDFDEDENDITDINEIKD